MEVKLEDIFKEQDIKVVDCLHGLIQWGVLSLKDLVYLHINHHHTIIKTLENLTQEELDTINKIISKHE